MNLNVWPGAENKLIYVIPYQTAGAWLYLSRKKLTSKFRPFSEIILQFRAFSGQFFTAALEL